MPTLTATPASPAANTYVTLEDATVYLVDGRLYSEAWTGATPTNQERALIQATRLLDEWFDWYGIVRTREQALRWPRSGVLDREGYNLDYDTIPVDVANATADLALELLKRDRSAEPELIGQGFRQARVGPLSVTVDDNARVEQIPRLVFSTLDHLGSPKAGPAGSQSRLVRA